jgi:hypothetical protein
MLLCVGHATLWYEWPYKHVHTSLLTGPSWAAAHSINGLIFELCHIFKGSVAVIPQNRVCFRKLSISLLRQSWNSPHFVSPEGSLTCSKDPTTCAYPESDACSLHLPTLFLSRSISAFSHLFLRLQSHLLPSGFPTKTQYEFLIFPAHHKVPQLLPRC